MAGFETSVDRCNRRYWSRSHRGSSASIRCGRSGFGGIDRVLRFVHYCAFERRRIRFHGNGKGIDFVRAGRAVY